MNKPKKIKRYGHNIPSGSGPDGHWMAELQDPEIVSALGEAASRWAHLEDNMIYLMGFLLGPDRTLPARLIYRTFSGPSYRIRLMQTLLQETVHNKEKGPEYDWMIEEFGKLSTLRNDYIHGLWWTHESGQTYLQAESDRDYSFLKAELTTAMDLKRFSARIAYLQMRIFDTLKGELRASPQSTLRQPS